MNSNFFSQGRYTDSKKKETFHAEILKKSNHIFRNCKVADIGNLMYGIPDPFHSALLPDP